MDRAASAQQVKGPVLDGHHNLINGGHALEHVAQAGPFGHLE